MKSKVNVSLLFSIFYTFIFIFVAFGMLYFAYKDRPVDLEDYLKSEYFDYVDRSDDMKFSADGGTQLYEAEKAKLVGGCGIFDNSLASGEAVVGDIRDKDAIEYTITSATDSTVGLGLNICYVPTNGKDCIVENLFYICLNDVEVGGKKSIIPACENEFNFKESIICELDLKAGKNTIDIIAYDSGYSVDYMILLTKHERNEQFQTIGLQSQAFSKDSGKQLYETEHMVLNNTIPVSSTDVSGNFYVRCDGVGESIDFYVNSNDTIDVALALAIKSFGKESDVSDICSVYVNGYEEYSDSRLSDKASPNGFQELIICFAFLNKGENKISIVSNCDSYALDYVALNADVNYSLYKQSQRYEAEQAFVKNCRIENNLSVSGGKNVVGGDVGSTITFRLNSKSEAMEHLSLRINYVGSFVSLDKIMEITVNNEALNLSVSMINNMGDNTTYADIYVGAVRIKDGDNVVVIKSKSKANTYSLDYITLFKTEISTGAQEYVLEAENAVLTNGSAIERNKTASSGQVVGYNKYGSTIEFSLLSHEACTVNMSLMLSCIAKKDLDMSDYVTIKVNGRSIDLYDKKMQGTSSWKIFANNNIGEIQLKSGLNTLTLISKDDVFNVDYIKLVKN